MPTQLPTQPQKIFRSYFFPILLLASIILGGLFGYFFKHAAHTIKPLGEIFLHLIFTVIVPLIFFSVASAVARAGRLGKLGKIALCMTTVFLFTSTVAAIFMLIVVQLFPPAGQVTIPLMSPQYISPLSFSDQIINIFTVADFTQLFSHEHMLALIVFAILVGLAAAKATEHEKNFVAFLHAGEKIFMRVFSLIMYYAPIGFFAYFSALVSELGPKLIESYLRIAIIYYTAALLYFFGAFSGFAYLAGKLHGVKLFWKNIFLPAATAIATCSSAASIPANLTATAAMRVTPDIYETVIPLGTMIHKDGSVLGAILKIAFLFGLFHLNFSDIFVLCSALGISLLVSSVMGAIPSGGMLGELLTLSIYGFPPSALMVIAAISIIVDPLATMLNVTGNSISSMMVARLVEGKAWFKHKHSTAGNSNLSKA